MSDWYVFVDNEVLDVRDLENHQLLEEIRDLLRMILQRLPSANVPVFPDGKPVKSP